MANDPQNPNTPGILQAILNGDPTAGLVGNSAPAQIPVPLAPPGSTAPTFRPSLGNDEGLQAPANEVSESTAAPSSVTLRGPAPLSFLDRLKGAAGIGPNAAPPAQVAKNVGTILGGVGNALALGFGSPHQKQLAIEQEQIPIKQQALQNEAMYRAAMGGAALQRANAATENAGTNVYKAQGQYGTGENGQPVGTARENAATAALRADYGQRLADERVKQIEASFQGKAHVDPNLAHAVGADDIADQDVSPLIYQQRIANVAKSRGFHTIDFGKDGPDAGQWVVDNVGRKIYQVTPFSPVAARGASFGANRPVPVVGPNGPQYMAAGQAEAMGPGAAPLGAQHQVLQIWQPALDSGERLQVMEANLERGLHGDQQAMLSLLANHLGMTMGLQKGARLNQAIISEAEQSRPWLEGMRAKFDDRGYLTGVVLSPQQMRQMLDLAEQRYQSDVQKARYEGSFYGINEEPMLPINPDNLKPNPAPRALPNRSNANATPNTPPASSNAPTRPAGVPASAVWNPGTKTWQIPSNK